MDWDAAERRTAPDSPEAAIWNGLQRLIAARRSTRATHAHGAREPLWTGNDHVYGLLRTFAGERLLVLANFSADAQEVRASLVDDLGLRLDAGAAVPDGRGLHADGDAMILAPYQFLWIGE